MKVNKKCLYLRCLYKELSCVKGMMLNFWISSAIWNKSFNIDIFIPNLFSFSRRRIFPISIISISVCKFKFTGVRLRECPRSNKSWGGSWLSAPKVSPIGYPALDNNLWLYRNYLNRTIC